MMQIIHILLLAMLTMFSAISCANSVHHESANSGKQLSVSINPSADEEYSVYSAYLRSKELRGNAKLLVIQEGTSGCTMYEDGSTQPKFGTKEPFHQIVKKRFQEVEQATLDDYVENNKTPEKLLSKFDLPIKYVIANDADIAPLFPKEEPDRAWKKFYAKYPNSTGILFFSKVGFNSKKTQAFIYAGRQCGGLCGLGKYILLEKKGSTWSIENEMELWAS
jgi:hypothetical protein